MNFLTPLWIIDNLFSVTLFKTLKSTTVFPETITSINEEKYFQVQSRIIDFKTKILFSNEAEIKLSANDINSLLFFSYCCYQARNLGDKAFGTICFFEIENNEIIMNELASFLIFKFKPLRITKYLRFELCDREIREFKKIVDLFGSKNQSDDYNLIDNKFSTNLIHKILVSPQYVSVDSYLKSSSMASDRLLAETIVGKIKSIQVLNNHLILRA